MKKIFNNVQQEQQMIGLLGNCKLGIIQDIGRVFPDTAKFLTYGHYEITPGIQEKKILAEIELLREVENLLEEMLDRICSFTFDIDEILQISSSVPDKVPVVEEQEDCAEFERIAVGNYKIRGGRCNGEGCNRELRDGEIVLANWDDGLLMYCIPCWDKYVSENGSEKARKESRAWYKEVE